LARTRSTITIVRVSLSSNNTEPRVKGLLKHTVKNADLKIPLKHGNYRTYAISLKIALPKEQVKTGYGTIWDKTQSLEYFKGLASKAKFKIAKEWSRGNVFYLEMCK
jgi:hypothetical protein